MMQNLTNELDDIVEILLARTREASQQRPQVLRRYAKCEIAMWWCLEHPHAAAP